MLNVKHDFTVHPKTVAPCVRAIGHTLDDVYGRYSAAKVQAYRYCKDLCEKYDGYDFCITSANTFAFTVSFDFINPDDNRPMRAVITRAYNHGYYLD